MKNIISRNKELTLFKQILGSEKSEFIAVYGRRRIGKTFLIREFFQEEEFYFEVTGMRGGTLQAQLIRFHDSMLRAFPEYSERVPTNWKAALENLDKEIRKVTDKKVIIFFDELPWLATRRSGLMSEIDYIWNSKWSKNKNIIFFVCGSAAAWMATNLFKTKGGLYNRVTRRVNLLPLKLSETREYLTKKNKIFSNNQIIELYLCLGGVPYYLDFVEKGLSPSQIINELCFKPGGALKNEYENLFDSLFDKAKKHYELMNVLANARYGVSRKQISKKVTGDIDRALEELELAGFIKKHISFGKKTRGAYYSVIDEYSLFYKKWIEPSLSQLTLKDDYWFSQINSPSYYSWTGYSYESLCQKHSNEILKALNISGMKVDIYSWRSRVEGNNKGAQIDIVLDRADKVISLGEIKYSLDPVLFNKSMVEKVKGRNAVFKEQTKSKKIVNNFLISSNGVIENNYLNELFFKVLTSDDLFS